MGKAGEISFRQIIGRPSVGCRFKHIRCVGFYKTGVDKVDQGIKSEAKSRIDLSSFSPT